MDTTELKEASVELMAQAECALLTTIGTDGYPHTRALFNLRNRSAFPKQAALLAKQDDELRVYFSTNTSSVKVREIVANPRVAVYYCDPSSIHGLMLRGEMTIVDDRAVKDALWSDGWERYYPKGPADPDYCVLSLRPDLAMGWQHGAPFTYEP
jgi:general stress protein 26